MEIEIKNVEFDSSNKPIEDISNRNSFCYLLEAEVGIVGKSGGDNFRFSVCNTMWLEEFLKSSGRPLFLNECHLLVVDSFDLESIKEILSKQLNDVVNKRGKNISWKNAALKINQYAFWEYFDEITGD